MHSRTWIIAMALLSLVATSASGQFVELSSGTTQIGNLTRTETSIQEGPSPINRFKMTRVVKDNLPPAGPRAVLLLMPSLGVEFTQYEVREPRRGYGASIVGFFAQRNFAVYGYSSPAEGLPAGACEAGVFDCSEMANWNIQKYVDDATYIRNEITADYPGVPVFVGGLSLGAITTIALINQSPGDYDGAILWEGTLATADPAIQATNAGFCAGLEAQLAAGIVFDGFGNNVFKRLNKQTELSPDAPVSIPLFPGFLTNHQALVASVSAPAPGPIGESVPNLILLNGDPALDQITFASEKRLFETVSRFNDYMPTATVRDISCSLAGSETTHTASLANFNGPILGIGGGLGYGPYMQDVVDLTGSTDVTMLIQPDFGHVDHVLHPFHRLFVERPILHWLLDRLP